MKHTDHVALIRNGVPAGGVWAELGSGDGAFTLALAEQLGPEGKIIAVDQDGRALSRLTERVTQAFPALALSTRQADFTLPLTYLPPLDGLLLANSLHFVRHKEPLLAILREQLLLHGRLVVVEYDTDHGNRWVPHPFSYSTWTQLAHAAGFARTDLLATHPSRFLGQFYAACSTP